MKFKFDNFITNVQITQDFPVINEKNALFVCDDNTKYIAEKVNGGGAPLCVIKSGEQNKNWDAVAQILQAAKNAGLSRKGILVGVGGGVIGDLTGFAASIYMRGCRLQLVATTLLAMVDASVGGKTGFDLFDIKNLAGAFYPAEKVYMPLDALKTLPEREYKSGLAELIKTEILRPLRSRTFGSGAEAQRIKESVKFKGKLVESDFKETKGKRALLNLGHTFGHALETAAGLGNITHGEAVAWGIVQACNLGEALKITPPKRANQIRETVKNLGYDTTTPHPLAQTETFLNALASDKKKNNQSLTFIVPNKKSAQSIILNSEQTKMMYHLLKNGNFS